MATRPSSGEDHLYLLPRSPLNEYLTFMAEYPVDAAELDRGTLAAEWKAADQLMTELRLTEPDAADDADLRPLHTSLRPLADKVEADPVFRRAFADATWEIIVVDLAQMVASQKLVSLKHIRRLQGQLGTSPSAEDVFRFCLPTERTPPDHRASRITDDEFAFASDSNDLRFLDAVLLRPDQIRGYQAEGPVAGIVALVVGFGSNFLTALAVNGRLVLNNGHHRACALYDLGIREVPCVVQTIASPEELEVHAPRAVRRRPDFYLTEARPPLLKDYFHATLGRTVRMGLTSKQVRVEYKIEELDMP